MRRDPWGPIAGQARSQGGWRPDSEGVRERAHSARSGAVHGWMGQAPGGGERAGNERGRAGTSGVGGVWDGVAVVGRCAGYGTMRCGPAPRQTRPGQADRVRQRRKAGRRARQAPAQPRPPRGPSPGPVTAPRRTPQVLPHPSGASRARTGDPLLAKQVLSQLSYGPLRVKDTQGAPGFEAPGTRAPLGGTAGGPHLRPDGVFRRPLPPASMHPPRESPSCPSSPAPLRPI